MSTTPPTAPTPSAPTRDPARLVLLDVVTTTVAFDKVNIARCAGKALPAGSPRSAARGI